MIYHMRQPRQDLSTQIKNFYSQNPVSADSYQPTQMQNEIRYPITYKSMK